MLEFCFLLTTICGKKKKKSVETSNLSLCKQHLVTTWVIIIDLWKVGGFLQVLQFPPPIKINDITEM